MKTGIYWQDPQYAVGRDFILDPSLVLYLPLYKLDGASIMSRDAYGHLCTVTGALWTPRGRDFDGSDDVINCGSEPSIDFTTDDDIIIEAWVKSDKGADEFPAGHNGGITTKSYSLVLSIHNTQWRFFNDLTTGGVSCYFGSVEKDVWVHLLAIRKPHFWATYKNGLYVAGDTPELDWKDFPANNLVIGMYSAVYFDGLIGEVRIYKGKVLTPLEIQHHYLAAKWRYR